MPDMLYKFKNPCYSYFAFKEIAECKWVEKVASGLQDGQVQNWYRLDCVQIDAAGFPAFMEEVRNEWLVKGWEQKVKLLILGSM
jgi:hypothetical protein